MIRLAQKDGDRQCFGSIHIYFHDPNVFTDGLYISKLNKFLTHSRNCWIWIHYLRDRISGSSRAFLAQA